MALPPDSFPDSPPDDALRDGPPPLGAGAAGWWRLLSARASWLEVLSERSYSMKMGELHLAGRSLFIVNEPGLARQVLDVHAGGDFTRHPAVGAALHPLLGDSPLVGLAGAHGGQAGSRARLAHTLETLSAHWPGVFDASLHDMVKDWRVRLCAVESDGTTGLDVEPPLRRALVEALLRAAVGREAAARHAAPMLEQLEVFERHCARMASPSRAALGLLRRWDTQRSSHAAARLRLLVADLLAERRRRWFVLDGETARPGWLEAIATAGGGREAACDRDLVDQVCTLMLTLHDQVAGTLAWALYLVARSPAFQARLRTEGERPMPPCDPQRLCATAWPQHRRAIEETLRLYAPIPFVPRVCARARTMRDKMLDEGDIVIASPWLIQRHRTYWDRPDDFMPDRFDPLPMSSAGAASSRAAWLPFGWGSHACPASGFVQELLAFALRTLLQAFEFRVGRMQPPRPVCQWSLRPAGGVGLLLRDRRGGS